MIHEYLMSVEIEDDGETTISIISNTPNNEERFIQQAKEENRVMLTITADRFPVKDRPPFPYNASIWVATHQPLDYVMVSLIQGLCNQTIRNSVSSLN